MDKYNQYAEFMKSRQCGFEGHMPLVCCPRISNDAIGPVSAVTKTKDTLKNLKDTINDGCSDGKHINSKNSSKPCFSSTLESKRPGLKSKISSECGKDLNYRHKSGVNTDLFDFPWLALLEYNTCKYFLFFFFR